MGDTLIIIERDTAMAIAQQAIVVTSPPDIVVFVSQQGAQGAPGAGGQNETILFSNVSTLTLPWNSTRRANFGLSGSFYVEIISEDDGIARWTFCEIRPDDINNTTQYFFNFGGTSTGRITIS